MLIDTTHYYYWALEDRLCNSLVSAALATGLYKKAWRGILNQLPEQDHNSINKQIRRRLRETMSVK